VRAIRDTRGCVNARVCMSNRQEALMYLFDEFIKSFQIIIAIRIASIVIPHAILCSKNNNSDFINHKFYTNYFFVLMNITL